jgi:amino acid adenylation domain-containing protein
VQTRAAVIRQPEAGSITRRISLRAAAAPKQVAVVDETGRLAYDELERESNRLAARLLEVGAGPEQCVGLFLPRSKDFVVAALAVLKSGAAYLPLDPSTPADRVSFILADAGVVALVSKQGIANDLTAGSWPVIETSSVTHATAPVNVEENRDNLAYVIYTSGSTGRPKGVEITHANLCNLIEWHQSAFAVTAMDRASQIAGLGFDAVGWEIWPYLTAGASLHIADESTRRSPELLRDWIVAQEITVGFVPTLFAEQLFHADWPAETALRLLLTGGDALQRRPPAGLPFAVINNYGPTECTVVATSGPVTADGCSVDRPSIGQPITKAAALILDEALRPVAPGEAGELCIGGALVGRGYRNMPELTASRFVTYIAASGESLRIYRTGDRVRKLRNGDIEFLGRFDDQVKIRGYRIELGEIVACLNRCPGIESSTVLVSDGPAGRALVAYVVPGRDARVTEGELRAYLAAKLPDYMIPAVFVSIPALPVMANGKLDKSALPVPCADNLVPSAATAAGATKPGDAIANQIAELVGSLLGRSSIGVDENFFMAGGHSMFGVQLVARVREAFGIKLSLRQLFKAPTIAALAVEVLRWTEAAKEAT